MVVHDAAHADVEGGVLPQSHGILAVHERDRANSASTNSELIQERGAQQFGGREKQFGDDCGVRFGQQRGCLEQAPIVVGDRLQ